MFDRLLLLIFDPGYVRREGDKVRRRMAYGDRRILSCPDCRTTFSQGNWRKIHDFVCPTCSCPDIEPKVDPYEYSPLFDTKYFSKRKQR